MEEGMKNDQEKDRVELIDPDFILQIAKALTYGAKKYAPNSWQGIDNLQDRYYAAAMRHQLAHKKGELIDEESGLPHLALAACCLMFKMYDDEKRVRVVDATVCPHCTGVFNTDNDIPKEYCFNCRKTDIPSVYMAEYVCKHCNANLRPFRGK